MHFLAHSINRPNHLHINNPFPADHNHVTWASLSIKFTGPTMTSTNPNARDSHSLHPCLIPALGHHRWGNSGVARRWEQPHGRSPRGCGRMFPMRCSLAPKQPQTAQTTTRVTNSSLAGPTRIFAPSSYNTTNSTFFLLANLLLATGGSRFSRGTPRIEVPPLLISPLQLADCVLHTRQILNSM